MDDKDLLIEKKKAQITKQQNFIHTNLVWIYPVCLAIGLTIFIVGIVFCTEGSYMLASGLFMVFMGLFCLITGAVCWPIYCKRRKNAPNVIKRLEKEIAELNGKINTEKTEKVKADESASVDLLLKYKQLLDTGAISEEEYNNKKKELLGR